MAQRAWRTLAGFALWLAVSAVGSAAAAAPDCRVAPPPHAAQPCFVLRGRLWVANGNPTFRLRRQGSARVLGVVGGDGDAASAAVLPSALRAAMTPTSPGELRPVTGVFRVCPLAPERPGRMRPVCIAEDARLARSAR